MRLTHEEEDEARMMLSRIATTRDLNTAYAFFERNWNLIRRYLGWEVVWIVYSLVNALTILFIAAATEQITGQPVDTRLLRAVPAHRHDDVELPVGGVRRGRRDDRLGTLGRHHRIHADGAGAALAAPDRHVLYRGDVRGRARGADLRRGRAACSASISRRPTCRPR